MSSKTSPEEISIIDKETYVLVKGRFDPEEAAEIVNTLFSKKINFHDLKSFSDGIRFGSQDETSEKRIKELKAARENAKRLLELAKSTGKSIRLNSEILVELV
ncbi:MAG: hypothetical protein WCD31_07275 [Gillisia sp.]